MKKNESKYFIIAGKSFLELEAKVNDVLKHDDFKLQGGIAISHFDGKHEIYCQAVIYEDHR